MQYVVEKPPKSLTDLPYHGPETGGSILARFFSGGFADYIILRASAQPHFKQIYRIKSFDYFDLMRYD